MSSLVRKYLLAFRQAISPNPRIHNLFAGEFDQFIRLILENANYFCIMESATEVVISGKHLLDAYGRRELGRNRPRRGLMHGWFLLLIAFALTFYSLLSGKVSTRIEHTGRLALF
jgi:hypothetical protein